MTTPSNSTSTQDTEPSMLDRRRGRAQSAKEVADRTETRVTGLDTLLAAIAAQAQHDQAALQSAQDEVVRLKRALKSAAKETSSTRDRRKKAAAAAAKAKLKARAAEAKYDQAVLADIVRREKDRDRAAAVRVPTGEPTGGTAGPAGDGPAVKRPDAVPAPAGVPAAERPTAGRESAIRTAARRTAAAAGAGSTGAGSTGAGSTGAESTGAGSTTGQGASSAS